MRSEITKELKKEFFGTIPLDNGSTYAAAYDPFDKNHYEAILKHFEVKVWPAYEEIVDKSFWGYCWKGGGVQLCSKEYLTEEQARAVTALAVYLYCHNIDCSLDDRIAMAYIKQGWTRYHSILERELK